MSTEELVDWMEECVAASGFLTRRGSNHHPRGFYIDGLPTGTTNGFYVLETRETPCLVLHEEIELAGGNGPGEQLVGNWRSGDTQLEFRDLALDGSRGTIETILPRLCGRVLNRLHTLEVRS